MGHLPVASLADQAGIGPAPASRLHPEPARLHTPYHANLIRDGWYAGRCGEIRDNRPQVQDRRDVIRSMIGMIRVAQLTVTREGKPPTPFQTHNRHLDVFSYLHGLIVIVVPTGTAEGHKFGLLNVPV